jgi:hypothetical protein
VDHTVGEVYVLDEQRLQLAPAQTAVERRRPPRAGRQGAVEGSHRRGQRGLAVGLDGVGEQVAAVFQG